MGGLVFHVLNRAARRACLFESPSDYEAFEWVLREALCTRPTKLLDYCVMPNHFHFVLLPETDRDLSRFMHWFTTTHGHRWRLARGSTGQGAVYQGRFKAIPVEADDHFLRLCRYVERNPLRAGLVERAERWRWSGLWQRLNGNPLGLADWPVPEPERWLDLVNGLQNEAEIRDIRNSVHRGCPYGNVSWQAETSRTLGLDHTMRPMGRPRRQPKVADRNY